MMTSRSLVGLVLLTSLASCSKQAAEEVESETVVQVKTEPAALGTIRATLSVTGTVAAAPGADLLVIAPEPARIVEIPKAEGDAVNAGDLLVRFEIPAYAIDVAAKRGEVARAQARIDNARAAQIDIVPGARGFVFNADLAMLVKFLEIGTRFDVRDR